MDSRDAAGWVPSPGKSFRILVLIALIAMAGYAAIAIWSGLGGVIDATAKVGAGGMLSLLGLSCIGYAIRFFRWRMYLGSMGYRVPILAGMRIYIAGFALTATPGKVGETLRSVLLKPMGVPYTQSLAAMLSERMSDISVIVMFALVGLGTFPQARNIVLPGLIIILILYSATLSATLLQAAKAWCERGTGLRAGLAKIFNLLLAARHCNTWRIWPIATLLGVAAWSCEILAFSLLLDWMGAAASPGLAIFTYATSTLAGALSFLPGGLGSAEVAMTSLLVSAGLNMSLAVAATIIIRLVTLWFAVALGVIATIWHGNLATPTGLERSKPP
jgi:uncharacterized protein (TIRG00374 family)